jgi:hypothetical protein
MAPPYLFLSHPSYSSSIHPFFPITFQVVYHKNPRRIEHQQGERNEHLF